MFGSMASATPRSPCIPIGIQCTCDRLNFGTAQFGIMALLLHLEQTVDDAGHSPAWCKVPHAVQSFFGLSGYTVEGGLLVLLLDLDLGRHLARPSIAFDFTSRSYCINMPLKTLIMSISKHYSSIILMGICSSMSCVLSWTYIQILLHQSNVHLYCQTGIVLLNIKYDGKKC